jgi:AcrR family transcriptional regulator
MSPTRLRILLAGLALFGDRGYHGTSIRDIAAEAGMQSASLYSHFASKEAILAELTFIGHDVHHRMLLAALLESGPDPRDQLRSLMTAHVGAHCRYVHLAIVSNYERLHVSPDALAPSNALREQSAQLLVDVVSRGVEQGVFDVADRDATIGALGALGLTSVAWYGSYEGPMTPEEAGAAYARLALRMLGVPS